jgi:hypothetical protein
MSTTHLEYFIPHKKEGQYLTLPFEMPQDTESFTLSYQYQAQEETPKGIAGGSFTASEPLNTIDLGLLDLDGNQVGVSGSNKQTITLSETDATPGYAPRALTAGTWQILIGAYKVAPQGVTVTYELSFTPKERKLLIGDIHTHTHASDGVLSLHELAVHAKRHGLDFLAVTDHNQMVSRAQLPKLPGITLIPGVEWTHYQGHANFLGVDKPYDGPFFANNAQDALARFRSARERGALIVINHPFDDCCGFQYDLQEFPFDAIEVWNGPMRESNLRAVGLWQSLLQSGKQIPAVGGSDYHRDNLFQILGGPCMGVYAMSNSPSDILDAIRAGHSFITFAPNGPRLELQVGEWIMGDTVKWRAGQTLEISATGLNKGDVVRVITAVESTDLFVAPSDGAAAVTFPIDSPGFARVEIHRVFLPGVPALPALISNPIYFE